MPVTESDMQNAARACKAGRAADPAAFAGNYGTNKTKRNAYGKCVSAHAQRATQDTAKDRANAAKTCKARKQDDPSAFDHAYGTMRTRSARASPRRQRRMPKTP